MQYLLLVEVLQFFSGLWNHCKANSIIVVLATLVKVGNYIMTQFYYGRKNFRKKNIN